MKLLLLLFMFPFCIQAGVIHVDDDNTTIPDGSKLHPYSSIQLAIDNSNDNDTIKVAVGNYYQIDNMGKALTILGGYTGGNSAVYLNDLGGDFSIRSTNNSLTIISSKYDSIGVNLTRFNFNPFKFIFDNFTVKNCRKGIVCDIVVSWPHVENVTISNNIIENNGHLATTSLGAGLIVAGNHHQIRNNTIRNNKGGRGAGIAGNSTLDSIIIADNQIMNNTGYDDHCGGIYLGGYATIYHNVISGNRLENSYGWGGGVLILGTAYMSYNIIKDNFCPSYGGALFVDEGGIAYLENELIYHNSTALEGAGVALDYGSPGSSYVYMTNCTVANNYSPGMLGGNAVYVDVSSFCTIKNCIMYGNGDDFYVNSSSRLTSSYTLSEESIPGVGNLIADPMFADSIKEDFHVKSKGGRFNTSTQTWVIDTIHSPSIDIGDPSSTYDNEPTPNGKRINLGCYGNTSEASKSSNTSSIESILVEEKTNFSIVPNPSNGDFQLKVGNERIVDCTIILYNVLGEKVFLKDNINSNFHMNLNLPLGIYYYQIKNHGFVVTYGNLVIQ